MHEDIYIQIVFIRRGFEDLEEETLIHEPKLC